jgi:hypothetical protein
MELSDFWGAGGLDKVFEGGENKQRQKQKQVLRFAKDDNSRRRKREQIIARARSRSLRPAQGRL